MPDDICSTPPWTGTPQTLQTGSGTTMSQTPNGAVVLGYWNKSTTTNEGQITLTSGGAQPMELPVPALANAPSLQIANWCASNLTVTNTSVATATPIGVEAFGPGIPGVTPQTLSIGEPLQLATFQAAQGNAAARSMQLVMQAGSGQAAIVALIGGPPRDDTGLDAYVFALNTAGDVPPGYDQVSAGNRIAFSFNWGAASVFVANMSPSTGSPVTVTLLAL